MANTYLTIQITSSGLTIDDLNRHSGDSDPTKSFEALNALQNLLNGINGGVVSGLITVEVATSDSSSTLTHTGANAKDVTYTF